MNEPSIEKYFYNEVDQTLTTEEMSNLVKDSAKTLSHIAMDLVNGIEQCLNKIYPNPIPVYVGKGCNIVFVNPKNGEFHVIYQTDKSSIIAVFTETEFCDLKSRIRKYI